MKKLLLFAVAGALQFAAIAQTAAPGPKPHTYHKKVATHKKKQPDVQWVHHGQATTVAKDDHNAYEGKPSQANDGVNKNKQRNINANTPTQLAPINGNGGR